jgi:hypothetical protein
MFIAMTRGGFITSHAVRCDRPAMTSQSPLKIEQGKLGLTPENEAAKTI